MPKFKLHSKFKPKGDQPKAIAKIVEGLKKGLNKQTLLGVTGSGKTFTMANVISQVNKPTLVLAHNKTLAAQLYNEFKEFFPENRVEYFVSYYDYYQPESYIPARDQYIEKDAQINPKIEQLRLSATASLLSRKDTIVIASVSCIYSVGNPEYFKNLGFELKQGQKITRKEILKKLVDIQFERNDSELMPGRFRVKGDTIDFIPGYFDNIIRIEMFGDEIERLIEVEKTTNDVKDKFPYFYVYPAKHFVMPESEIAEAIEQIKLELDEQLPKMDMIEAHRLKQRTMHDIEMIGETGFCKGIENYSRFFEHRKKGERPFCLMDYFGDDFLLLIDESHQSLPQVRGMYNGDFARKKNLVEYGFRLPSAFDNRPLQFSEFEMFMKKHKVIFISATPADYEKTNSSQIVEQIIRPTGLIDPLIEIKPSKDQIKDIKRQIEKTIKKGNRVLLTTITKKLAEELSDYLASQNIRARYLHSEIDTLERTEIIRQLRAKDYDVLVGINLLREGLDIPEVGFIGILDADKEGFLRDARSLIQIIGRAARNVDSTVTLYADKQTDSIKKAISETSRRRKKQMEYNQKHNITPKTIIKNIPAKVIELKDTKHIPKAEAKKLIPQIEKEMKQAANRLDFELAIALRDRLNALKNKS
ncbi:excinuclease ABC subunit UvrB [Candidatus Woesearchaeota archaeon]|jgi:excinuclease ABC subunit B|nr:excinuclease ABC subunit UvrB [Candidatus Woesearchaeota archaeon]